MSNRRRLFLSGLIALAYALGAWIWFESSSTSPLGSIIFIPFVLAYGAGYGGGEAVFWLVLLGQLVLTWLIIHAVFSALLQSSPE